jgi:hypothetical protein
MVSSLQVKKQALVIIKNGIILAAQKTSLVIETTTLLKMVDINGSMPFSTKTYDDVHRRISTTFNNVVVLVIHCF